MIGIRIRMFGSRTVELLAEPDHPALAGRPLRAGHQTRSASLGSEALAEAMCDLSGALAARLLRSAPQPFSRLTH